MGMVRPHSSPLNDTKVISLRRKTVNHVKKWVASNLETIKSQFTGFETILDEKRRKTRSAKNATPVPSTDASADDEVRPFIEQGNKKRKRRRLPDGKPCGGGASRMTKVMEQKLSDCYGLAIRQSSESAESMLVFHWINRIEPCSRSGRRRFCRIDAKQLSCCIYA